MESLILLGLNLDFTRSKMPIKAVQTKSPVYPESLNLSKNDKVFGEKFGGNGKSFYFCISKIDKYIIDNDKIIK